MTLETRIKDFITDVGTDYKAFRTFMTGSAIGTFDLATTSQNIRGAIDELKTSIGAGGAAATESAQGTGEIATTTEVTDGADDFRWVTPLKLAQKLTAWAQPLSSELTTLAGVTSGAFGRTLLGSVDASSAKTSLGLATVATSGSASDITTGTLPSSVMPPLVIKETFTVADEAAMLALTAQRGDVAIRSDENSKMYILSSDSPGTLADWKQVMATGDVVSVQGRTGAVTITKTDVGLGSADDTSDADKPVSTAQAAADNLRLLKTANLSDVATPATALGNLGGAALSATGDLDADFVAAYTTAKA